MESSYSSSYSSTPTWALAVQYIKDCTEKSGCVFARLKIAILRGRLCEDCMSDTHKGFVSHAALYIHPTPSFSPHTSVITPVVPSYHFTQTGTNAHALARTALKLSRQLRCQHHFGDSLMTTQRESHFLRSDAHTDHTRALFFPLPIPLSVYLSRAGTPARTL